MGQGQQRLTAEQRRRIEEEEERREAEYAAELARQRAILNETEHDSYVTRRVEREMEAIAEAQRREEEEERQRSGGGRDPNPYLLLLLGGLISALLLALASLVGR